MSPEKPGPAPTPAQPPNVGQELSGELRASISRLRLIASSRPAARPDILAEVERLEPLVAKVAALERGGAG